MALTDESPSQVLHWHYCFFLARNKMLDWAPWQTLTILQKREKNYAPQAWLCLSLLLYYYWYWCYIIIGSNGFFVSSRTLAVKFGWDRMQLSLFYLVSDAIGFIFQIHNSQFARSCTLTRARWRCSRWLGKVTHKKYLQMPRLLLHWKKNAEKEIMNSNALHTVKAKSEGNSKYIVSCL